MGYADAEIYYSIQTTCSEENSGHEWVKYNADAEVYYSIHTTGSSRALDMNGL